MPVSLRDLVDNNNSERLKAMLSGTSVEEAELNRLFARAVDRGHNESILELLASGADINYQLPMGESVLFWAIQKGHTATSLLLIEHNIDKDMKTPLAHTTALMCAAKQGQVEVVEALVNAGADAGMTNKKGESALTIAEEAGHTEVVEKLSAAQLRP